MTLRLRQVALVAADRDRVVADLRAVFGLEVGFEDPRIGTLGLHNAVLPVGEEFIEVVAPVREGTTAERYLHRRGGDGGYMLILQTDDHALRRRRVDELGVRIVAQFDDEGFTDMQLHPADTGGTFLEVDQQEDADGWHPAGHAWRKAIRTDVSTGIAGADVQCNDPVAVARRWSEILDVPVTSGTTLELDGSVIRFVPITDGRPEGLAGVDIAVHDADDVRRRATDRGLGCGDDHIAVGGMRFSLVGSA